MFPLLPEYMAGEVKSGTAADDCEGSQRKTEPTQDGEQSWEHRWQTHRGLSVWTSSFSSLSFFGLSHLGQICYFQTKAS